jgi:hypothetical protein
LKTNDIIENQRGANLRYPKKLMKTKQLISREPVKLLKAKQISWFCLIAEPNAEIGYKMRSDNVGRVSARREPLTTCQSSPPNTNRLQTYPAHSNSTRVRRVANSL